MQIEMFFCSFPNLNYRINFFRPTVEYKIIVRIKNLEFYRFQIEPKFYFEITSFIRKLESAENKSNKTRSIVVR